MKEDAIFRQINSALEVLQENIEKENDRISTLEDQYLRLEGKIALLANQQPKTRNFDKLQKDLEAIIEENAPDAGKRILNTIAYHFQDSNAIYQKLAYLGQLL